MQREQGMVLPGQDPAEPQLVTQIGQSLVLYPHPTSAAVISSS
jgi:hypothetical protein